MVYDVNTNSTRSLRTDASFRTVDCLSLQDFILSALGHFYFLTWFVSLAIWSYDYRPYRQPAGVWIYVPSYVDS